MTDFLDFCSRYNLHLNEQQAQAVTAPERAVLLLAVPGSGKTTTLVARLAYMLECQGVRPENMLTMTYTVAASRDMLRRFISVFGEELAAGLEFRTINSVCLSVINRYVYLTGGSSFELLDNNLRILSEVWQKVRHGEFPDESALKELQGTIGYIKNMRLRREEIEELQIDKQPAAPLYDGYIELMKSRRLMDYDDQLVYAYTILKRHPDILSEFRARYPVISLDEAQDTSRLQHEIIRLLAGDSGRIFMVGDEDQSIYGFRAAYPEALLNFEKDYRDSRVLLLERNYRATPELVKAADRFIALNPDRREKHMISARESRPSIIRLSLSDRAAQYSYIAKMVQSDPDRETAILYRNNDSSIPLIDMLDRCGIGFRTRQAENLFFTNRTVMGVRDILTLALNPLDEEAFMRVYYKFDLPISRANAEGAVQLCREGKAVSLIEALSRQAVNSDWVKSGLEELVYNFRALAKDSASEALSRLRYSMGYGVYILKSSGDVEHFYLLTSLAAREKDAASFLERLNSLRQLSESGGSRDSRLILSTVHSSKGLEYDRVIIIDALDGILPSTAAPADEKERREYAEERRLFYVAATRAKNELLLFTYQREPKSIFIDEFCSKPAPPQKKPAAVKAPARTAVITTPEAAPRFGAGNIVKHTKYGVGRVFRVSGGEITVIFPRYGKKSFSLADCEEKGPLNRL